MNIFSAPYCLAILLDQSAGQSEGGGFGTMLPMMIALIAIFYFLILRPQQKKQRLAEQERKKLLSSLKPNDKVVTTSGIYGTIIAVRENTVQLKIAQSVSVEMRRSDIQELQDGEVRADAKSDAKEAEAAK